MKFRFCARQQHAALLVTWSRQAAARASRARRILLQIGVLTTLALAGAAIAADSARAEAPIVNGRILYSRDGDIYSAKPDGSDARNLTRTTVALEGEAKWSADGRSIVFTRNNQGCCGGLQLDIYLMRADGSDVRDLTNAPQFSNRMPAWSPDGQRIAFSSSRGDGERIWIINLDGSGLRLLTTNGLAHQFPAWSPDGRFIASGSGGIVVTNVETGDTTIVTDRNDAMPRWSPDGSRILFSRLNATGWDLYTVTPDGATVSRVTTGLNALRAAWAPDGSGFVFERQFGSTQVWTMRADGSALHQATAGSGSSQADWQPVRAAQIVAPLESETVAPGYIGPLLIEWNIVGSFMIHVRGPEYSLDLGPTTPQPYNLGGTFEYRFFNGDTPMPVTRPGLYAITVEGEGFEVRRTFVIPAPLDSTPPNIIPNISGVQGDHGWYVGDVNVSWNVTDAESPIEATEGCTSTIITTDTSGTVITCRAESSGGVSSASVTIRRDSTAPTVWLTTAREPDHDGWFNHPIDYWAVGTDATSMIASCSPNRTYSGPDDATVSVAGTCTDEAGNSATASLVLHYDEIAPIVTYTGNAGVYTIDQTVNIRCSATDNVSGIAASTCTDVVRPAYLFAPGTNTLAATATDRAGNVGFAVTNFTVAVTTRSLCNLTKQFVIDSANYQALSPTVKRTVDVLVASICTRLDGLWPTLPLGHKAALIGTYQQGIDFLAMHGWLPAEEGVLLKKLAGALV